ncbi:tRNA (cytosine(72)-C(5))-methyltransferase NSUN6 isoform 4-T4 [Pholidichthys leucotaenia]
MPVFPRISLKPDVIEHLKSVFLNNEVLETVGLQEAECRFQNLLSCLSHPPSYTCVRASTQLVPLEEIRCQLEEELKKQQMCGLPPEDVSIQILTHPKISDVLLLPVDGPRPVKQLTSEVVVGAQCGSAVLRGAHVFAPGIIACPKFMKVGDVVSVFSDLEGRCTRGATSFQGNKVFVGNGVAEMDRSSIFCTDEPARGIGVRMVEPLYRSPSFDGVLPSLVFLQNLPSVVVGHVLGPRPGERILDMCAAPGGKTCHIAALMGDQAVQLLKKGGVLVYSTCTVTLAENEEQVAWALQTFPCLTLQPQEPHIGAEGMLGAGLSPRQLRLLQRFSPELSWDHTQTAAASPGSADSDTIGFFIAKFLKN